MWKCGAGEIVQWVGAYALHRGGLCLNLAVAHTALSTTEAPVGVVQKQQHKKSLKCLGIYMLAGCKLFKARNEILKRIEWCLH